MTLADTGVGGSSCRGEAGFGEVIGAKFIKVVFDYFRIGGEW